MELIAILSRCHCFQGFIYQYARFTPDKKMIEISVRPRQGFGRDLLAVPSTGARLRPTRRMTLRVHSPMGIFRLTPLRHATCGLPPLRRGHRRRSPLGRGQTHPDKGLYGSWLAGRDLGITRLLWVGKDRTIEFFQGFFTTIGEENTSKSCSSARTCGSPI
jgi:hypothetical protein